MRDGQRYSWLLWLVVLGALFGGAGAWRFFRVSSDLRFSAQEALWQLLPYALILLLAIGWLLNDRRRGE